MSPELIRFLLLGFVAGWISSIVVRGRILRVRGCLPYAVFGITGALAGGYLSRLIGVSDVAQVVTAGAGAIGALVFMQMLRNA